MTARPDPLFHWFIPIDGDGEHIGTREAERPPTFEYLRSAVKTAEDAGYTGMLIPTRFSNGLFDEAAPLAETWTMATALAAVTSRIRFLVAVRPGFIQTGLFAQMAATLSQLSAGRLDLNVVPGGIQGDMERLGERAGHDDRYARAEEFITACRRLWSSDAPVDFDGQYVQLRGALCSPRPLGEGPRLYTGGASERALAMAGRHSEVLLCWIEPLDAMVALLDRARSHYVQAGRVPRFGLRTHLVVRDTEPEAWAAAEELLSRVDPRVEAQRAAAVSGSPMVGASAQARRLEDDRLGRHLWNGISRVRVNLGTAIVGSPDQVADELASYWHAGFDEFILSGFPHVEESLRIARDVLPRVRQRISG